jgi:hypothetical protein
MRQFLSAAAVTFCCVLSGAAGAQEPRDCDEGTHTTVTGTIESVDPPKGTLPGEIWIIKQSLGECTIDIIELGKDQQPPASCTQGGTVSASGKVSLDEFDLSILVDPENLNCQ